MQTVVPGKPVDGGGDIQQPTSKLDPITHGLKSCCIIWSGSEVCTGDYMYIEHYRVPLGGVLCTCGCVYSLLYIAQCAASCKLPQSD